MPHNYIFGQEFSHHGVGSQLDGRFVGQTNCINGVGMKRKEAWLGLAAGNFELQKEDGGPTCEVEFTSGDTSSPGSVYIPYLTTMPL